MQIPFLKLLDDFWDGKNQKKSKPTEMFIADKLSLNQRNETSKINFVAPKELLTEIKIYLNPRK